MTVEERRERVRQLRNQGLTVHRIAARLYVHENTVRRDMRKLGLTQSRAVPRIQLNRAHLGLLYGMSYPEAAAMIGCSPETLRRRLPGFTLSRQETARRARMGRMKAAS